MAITPVNSTLTVTTAGTEVQCTATTSIKPTSVYFEALGTNTGYIYIGLSTVSSTVYMARLAAGEGFSLGTGAGANFRSGGQGIQLSALYVDSSVNGEKVQMTYMYEQGG
jgi:hypothetical protein